MRLELQHGLETFLRGMETTPPKRRPEDIEPLKPSLEGWKRASASGIRAERFALETFLRGMETFI